MIIPELEISFSGALKISCSAQVIYRLKEGEKGKRCGLAIYFRDSLYVFAATLTLLTVAYLWKDRKAILTWFAALALDLPRD